MRRRWNHGIVACAVLALLAVGCSSGPGASPTTSSPTPTSANRPASPAKLSIVSPRNGQVVHGTTVELKVILKDAKIVPATTADIVPDEGHLHVILDDRLISMTGDTQQLIGDLTPGQHLLKVEFVASDHAPFDPRVIAAVAFEVKA
ncbi:MAG: hypothetical protein ACRDH7_00090 [Actinomycetota bacterium]